MADFYGPWGNPYNTYRTWISVGYSQSIAGNYTNVSVGAYFQDRYGYGLWGNLRNIVYIAGTLVRDSSHGIAGGANASTYIAGSSLNVGHNADGTIGGIGVSSQMIDVNYYNGTASGTIYVPTIPRATTPNWSGNFVTGTAKTINLPRASTSFTHTVQYSFGSTGFVNIATGAGGSTSWTPPQTLASQIPNAASGTGTIRVITYSGSTNIGTKDVSFTLDLDSTIVPTVSAVTWSDNNSVVATNIGAFVRGLSQVKGVVTSAGVYGSTISSKYVNIGGTTANENVGVLLTGSGTISAVAYSTDSRGRAGSLTQNITSLEYSPPSIISSIVQRAFSNGTPNGEGTYLRVDLNASVSSLIVNSVQKNAMKISVRTKQNGSSWVDRNVINTGLTHNTYFLVSGGGIFSVASSYDVEIAITDNTSVSASAVSTRIPTATVTLDLDGTSVGVGKYHENGVLDVAGDVYTSGDLYTSGGVVGLSTKVVPAGAIIAHAGATAPPNWLICDGAAVSRTQYASLYNAIGTTYGAGDGSTTFNLPNLKGRVPVGRDSAQTEFNTLGETGGAKTHTLTDIEVPKTAVGMTTLSLTGAVSDSAYGSAVNRYHLASAGPPYPQLEVKGGGQPHNNLQPYQVVNYIIKT